MTEIVFAYDKSEYAPGDRQLVRDIESELGMLKVGLEAMYAIRGDGVSVAQLVAEDLGMRERRSQLLWDAKLHDIPNTVAGAVRNLAGKVGGVTIHASAGPKVL